jgi:hypothetical protein
MRKTMAVLMVAVLLAAAGCSKDDEGKGVDVKVEKKDSGGY